VGHQRHDETASLKAAIVTAVGAELAHVRERYGRTVDDVATRCGVDPVLLERLETGDPSDIGLAIDVCIALNVRFREVVTRAEAVALRQWKGTTTMDNNPGEYVLGYELKRARDESGFRLPDAARELGWPSRHLEQIESNLMGVSVAELRGMLALYGVTEPDSVAWYIGLLPLPCDHERSVPVALCVRCRAIVDSRAAPPM
jgi:transcriptional regulator with XRE-family HTH domain